MCEAFQQELDCHNLGWSQQLTVRNVDDSPEWNRQYGGHVPVLVINGQMVCEYFFDPDKTAPYFRDQK